MIFSLRAPTIPNPLRLLGALRPSRRVWCEGELALVEVRGLDAPGGERVGEAVRTRLEALPGVAWAEAQRGTGRVGISFDPGLVTIGELVDVVAAAELGTAALDHDADHPADGEPLRRAAVALAADVAGLGLGAFGRLARMTPLPVEVATAVSWVDHSPPLRRAVEQALGAPIAEVALAVANAVTQGLSQGPASLVVDAAHRAQLIGEIRARQRVWSRRAPELSGPSAEQPLPQEADRPAPLPAGPIESYGRWATAGGLTGGLLALAAAGRTEAATQAFQAALPKAARLGRESFAAQLGRTLAARGVVPLDGTVLRRLDRIDMVVVDPAVLEGPPRVDTVAALDGADAEQVRDRAERLLAQGGDGIRWDGDAALGPVDLLGLPLPRGGKTRQRELRRGRATVLALAVGGTVRGLVRVGRRPDPAGEALMATLERTGLRVVHGGGERAVRDAQRAGGAVAVVSASDSAALAAADCGIGIVGGGGPTPWTADLLGDLEDAALILHACDAARQVSRRSATFALGGSGVGGFVAFLGPRRSASLRASLAVNAAAAAAMASGTWSAASLTRTFAPIPIDPTPWHMLPPEAALNQLGTGAAGLPAAEALQRSGNGAAEERSGLVARLVPFADELANPLTPVLAVGAGLSAAAGSVVDAGIVTGLIALNALVGGIQRLRTEREIAKLLEASNGSVRVRRDGEEMDLSASELVVGDVVVYRQGDVVAGDARVLEAEALEVDESTLTGESFPVPKHPEPDADLPVADRHSMLYDGTTVSAGRAVAVIVATSPATEAGRSLAAADVQPPPSGVERRLAELTSRTIPIALGAGAAVTAAGILHRWPTPDIVGSGVSLAVASVPEGLPFVANVAQLAAARRLAEHHALVRNPRAIEALGRVDLLCFDKTGTLTKGKIKLREVSDGVHADDVRDLRPELRPVLVTALRANPRREDGRPENETDAAVAKGAARAGVDAGWTRVAELPFDPRRGLFAALGADEHGRRLAVKGAPEAVLPRCGGLGEAERARLEAEVERLAETGARVLAVAGGPAGDGDELDERLLENLEFAGFLVFSEAVRNSAVQAVNEVRAAGVEVVMITGDHPSTARSIADELGILNGGRVMTGPELDGLDDEALAAALPGVTVFARVTPNQKVRIVRGLQKSGHTLAMTGDGANDAASIRLADCGIAVGKRSAPAARDAADIVVTTNRVETIVAAIVEGRAMWGSVRDALGILVGGNLGEIGFSVAGSLLGGSPALNARQLLLVNLLTDLAPAVVIAVRPPRDTSSQALLAAGPDVALGGALSRTIATRAVTTGLGATGAYLAARVGGSPARARTVALAALVGAQLGQTLVAGGGSRLVLATGILSTAALVGVVQTPGLSQFFGCQPLGPGGWATAATAAGLATAGSVALSAVLERD